MQPVTVEIDTGSSSARGGPPGRIWLIRLRHGERSVITTIGLSRTSAEHLAQRITDLLPDPKTPLDVVELTTFLEFYAGWLEAEIDHARACLPLYGTYNIDDLRDDTARIVKTLKALKTGA